MFKVILREWRRLLSRPIYLFCIFIVPLVSAVMLTSLMGEGLPTEMPVGIVDHPGNQEQFVFEYDLDGNTLILGLPGSGKSTFLQTLLYALFIKHTPAQIQVYGADYSSRITACFESFPHCGGIVFENEEENLVKIFQVLKNSQKIQVKR